MRGRCGDSGHSLAFWLAYTSTERLLKAKHRHKLGCGRGGALAQRVADRLMNAKNKNKNNNNKKSTNKKLKAFEFEKKRFVHHTIDSMHETTKAGAKRGVGWVFAPSCRRLRT